MGTKGGSNEAQYNSYSGHTLKHDLCLAAFWAVCVVKFMYCGIPHSTKCDIIEFRAMKPETGHGREGEYSSVAPFRRTQWYPRSLSVALCIYTDGFSYGYLI